jgi:hypothetical protein
MEGRRFGRPQGSVARGTALDPRPAGRRKSDRRPLGDTQVLRVLRRDEGAIANFLPYVATVARNAVNLAIRRTNPQWSSMANSVRYVLNHQPDLSLWRLEDHREIAGFAGDRGQPPIGDPSFPLDAEGRFVAEHGRDPRRARVKVELVRGILRAAGGPLALETVVSTAMRWCALPETRTASLDAPVSGDLPLSDTFASHQPGVERALMSREIVQQLWEEIRGLGELVHRRVLLLNLSEGAGAEVETFEEQHLCTVGDIADTLEYDREWFAALCNRLPLADAEIAVMLSLTTDQVSARRKSARRTLGRRLAAKFASHFEGRRQGSRPSASTE